MQQLYSPVCTFILAPHVSDETSRSLHPSFMHAKKNKKQQQQKKSTPNGLLAQGVYSSERLGTYECCMHWLTFFTLTSACLADEEAKVRRNRTLWEQYTVDSSCSTYRVGKVQSIFSLPINKKLFRYSVIPYSAFYRLTN